jgi:chemotaxis signal transduction protein
MSSILKNINDMTKTYLHNIMQILVFQLGNRCYYGTNVSKVRSIEDINKYTVIRIDTEN